MRYLTLIRSLGIMLLGILTYSFLLLISGWRIPGTLRRHKNSYKDNGKQKTWVVIGFLIILAAFIVLGIVILRIMIVPKVEGRM